MTKCPRHHQDGWPNLLIPSNCDRTAKGELPHPVSACVFCIALRFQSNNFFFHRHQQTKVSNKKMQRSAVNACMNGMCKCALNYTSSNYFY